MKHHPSPNFDDRTLSVDMLVLHYTGLSTLEESLARLCGPASKVSAHYLVNELGEVFNGLQGELTIQGTALVARLFGTVFEGVLEGDSGGNIVMVTIDVIERFGIG